MSVLEAQAHRLLPAGLILEISPSSSVSPPPNFQLFIFPLLLISISPHQTQPRTHHLMECVSVLRVG